MYAHQGPDLTYHKYFLNTFEPETYIIWSKKMRPKVYIRPFYLKLLDKLLLKFNLVLLLTVNPFT